MEYRNGWYTTQDGLRLYFRDYGPINSTKTSVLCLSGLTRNSHDFSRLAVSIASDRRVICPDYRGRGKSDYDPNWRNYTPVTHINDIRHLLISLNLDNVFVVGSSTGGLLTMAMGAAMPRTLAGALINDIGPVIEKSGMNKILSYVRNEPPAFDQWTDAMAYMRQQFPELSAKSDEDWAWITEGTFRKTKSGRLEHDWDVRLVRPLLKIINNLDLWPLFRTLRHLPVVVIRGGNSDILSASTLSLMSKEIPGLVSITVNGVGHMPSLLEIECQEALRNALALVDNSDY